jgi:hypothetical protein
MGKPDPCACSTFVGLQGLICQQEARDEGNPAHHITFSDWTRSHMETWCWGRFEVLDFYNFTLPASSIGLWMGKFSSSKVVKLKFILIKHLVNQDWDEN